MNFLWLFLIEFHEILLVFNVFIEILVKYGLIQEWPTSQRRRNIFLLPNLGSKFSYEVCFTAVLVYLIKSFGVNIKAETSTPKLLIKIQLFFIFWYFSSVFVINQKAIFVNFYKCGPQTRLGWPPLF
jgi:hypothetical protein